MLRSTVYVLLVPAYLLRWPFQFPPCRLEFTLCIAINLMIAWGWGLRPAEGFGGVECRCRANTSIRSSTWSRCSARSIRNSSSIRIGSKSIINSKQGRRCSSSTRVSPLLVVVVVEVHAMMVAFTIQHIIDHHHHFSCVDWMSVVLVCVHSAWSTMPEACWGHERLRF